MEHTNDNPILDPNCQQIAEILCGIPEEQFDNINEELQNRACNVVISKLPGETPIGE